MDDWQKGDLALCVNDAPNPFYGGRSTVARGRVYTVEAVSERRPHSLFGMTRGLLLSGIRSKVSALGSFAEQRFRKIKPLTDEEREQFAAEMNTREPANA
jgi:hypothetical protein